MQVEPVVMTYDSPLGWMGGKTKLRSTIVSCFPPHNSWIEVFAGSATVFFGKPAKMSKIEVINDIHSELVNLMRVISGTYFDESIRQEFIGYVRSMPPSREAFQDWQKWTTEQREKLNPAQRAFIYYYCVKNGFSSTPECGYAASPFGTNRYNMLTDFEPFCRRFKDSQTPGGAQIECLDFVTLIEKYNRKGVKACFFMDPPYFVADTTNYYAFVFDREKHLALKDCCDKIDANKNKFLITYDDVKDVFDLYAGYYIYRTDPIIYQSADERSTRDLQKAELFVTNYDIHKVIGSDLFGDDGAAVDMSDTRIDFKGNSIGIERVQSGK